MTLTRVATGKVREIYELDATTLLMVASDRMSAFDVVMAEPIPDKGRVLTGLTAFWDERLSPIAPTHLVSVEVPAAARDLDDLEGRVMVVRKAEMLPIECIVRGYLAGTAWAEYRQHGTVHGTPMPGGLRQSEQLEEPIFTPSIKATEGHDQNISFEEAVGIVGPDVAEEARRISLAAYQAGHEHACGEGIIVADTKFELGFVDGRLAICDEVLTPDSSRFWPEEHWAPGETPPSFDKQPLRDWLEATGWGKTPPPPTLPPEVVGATRSRYVAAYERLTGQPFTSLPGVVAA